MCDPLTCGRFHCQPRTFQNQKNTAMTQVTPSASAYNPSVGGAKMKFDDAMSYGDYLHKMLSVERSPELWHVRSEL